MTPPDREDTILMGMFLLWTILVLGILTTGYVLTRPEWELCT